MRPIMKPKPKNPGDRSSISKEEVFEEIGFKVHKITSRPRPSKEDTNVICCFSEFGCETVGAIYCLPRIIKDHPQKYRIVVGWHGREYLYRHLADEFWEMNEDHMWLREYARAFHNESKNLERTEKALEAYGTVVPSAYMGKIAISAKCFDCRLFYNTVYAHSRYENNYCPRCRGKNILNPILGDVAYWKPKAIRLPPPSDEKMEVASGYVSGRPVGVFARSRKCYGRNLQPSFYEGLVELLRRRGYEPIWLGEKQSTLACPVNDVVDFSRMPESRDLETTLAIVSKCEFTVQFWTASSRLAGLMGVPYLLFESPDQIWGNGQEGIRRNLCDFGKRKLSVNHYLNVYHDNNGGLGVVDQCVGEMEAGNWGDHIGMVEKSVVESMRLINARRVGDV